MKRIWAALKRLRAELQQTWHELKHPAWMQIDNELLKSIRRWLIWISVILAAQFVVACEILSEVQKLN